MQVYIDSDEFYLYLLSKEQTTNELVEIQLTDAEWQDYNRVCDEMTAWQKRIEKMKQKERP
jgi:K+/H+ antiporter YhaU regulatory subunit KhtT